MNNSCNLIVMLTKDDMTVQDAASVFEQCRNTSAEWFGFKEKPLEHQEMKRLCSRMKECGKKTALEVVAYSEEEGLHGAKTAAECGFDMVMGTKYSPLIHSFCKKHGLKYMPFVGTITGRPSVLEGSVDELAEEAKALEEAGVDGIDLLGYRAINDPDGLIDQFVQRTSLPVCAAGSVNSFSRLDTLKKARPWAFTIGSAFFDHLFGDDLPSQIETVCSYMNSEQEKGHA